MKHLKKYNESSSTDNLELVQQLFNDVFDNFDIEQTTWVDYINEDEDPGVFCLIVEHSPDHPQIDSIQEGKWKDGSIYVAIYKIRGELKAYYDQGERKKEDEIFGIHDHIKEFILPRLESMGFKIDVRGMNKSQIFVKILISE